MNYLDTSALIKRFVAEKGSPLVQTLVKRKGPIATAKIAYAEVYAGLTRKLHEDHLSDAQYALACRQFEADWLAYVRVELHDDTLFLARDLIRRHPLKGFDAVHLASAISLQNALGEDITFAAADERLLRAAEAEDLKILHVEIARTP
ncbi:type II toxin-antitoxin system VapC family toxin [Candidatus Methylomirabilis sp.]|uniref:type II toxin-antitoxin system VapC family toxin n=1 Tax=Candidatus Methylomirabilis sp. TaxID=2032687 RepID=UPI003076472E